MRDDVQPMSHSVACILCNLGCMEPDLMILLAKHSACDACMKLAHPCGLLSPALCQIIVDVSGDPGNSSSTSNCKRFERGNALLQQGPHSGSRSLSQASLTWYPFRTGRLGLVISSTIGPLPRTRYRKAKARDVLAWRGSHGHVKMPWA